MRSATEILEQLDKTIAHMHNRVTLYAGPLDAPSAADVIEGMFWQVHSWWAWIQQRDKDFQRVLATIHTQHKCGAMNFAGSYRRGHPNATEEEVSRFVLDAWKDVSVALGIDITEARGCAP